MHFGAHTIIIHHPRLLPGTINRKADYLNLYKRINNLEVEKHEQKQHFSGKGLGL